MEAGGRSYFSWFSFPGIFPNSDSKYFAIKLWIWDDLLIPCSFATHSKRLKDSSVREIVIRVFFVAKPSSPPFSGSVTLLQQFVNRFVAIRHMAHGTLRGGVVVPPHFRPHFCPPKRRKKEGGLTALGIALFGRIVGPFGPSLRPHFNCTRPACSRTPPGHGATPSGFPVGGPGLPPS